MKKLSLLLCCCAGILFGAQTMNLDFSKDVSVDIAGQTINFPSTNGYLVLGSNGYKIPADKLVGKQGTILIKFKQNKPEHNRPTNRAPFTLRCNSRMTATLYITHDNISHFNYAFGDRDEQIYCTVQPEYEFGREYWMGLSWNGRQVQLFSDGKLLETHKQGAKMENVAFLYLGPYTDGWNGLPNTEDDTFVRELKLYDSALTPAEVAAECGIKLVPSIEQFPGKLTVPLVDDLEINADGDLKETVWKQGASLPVLTCGANGPTYSAPEGRFLMLADSKNLYLGLDYLFPIGNAVNAGTLRTPDVKPEVWGTESFEFYMIIGQDTYRFGGNVAGGYTEGKNNGNDWNTPWSYASQLRFQIDNTNLWQAEAAIPWSSIGLDAPPSEPIKFVFCRTWCLPDYSAATSVAVDGEYLNKDSYLDLVFSRNAPTIRKLSGNDPTRGAFQQKVSITSPVAGKVRYDVEAADASGASRAVPVVSKEYEFKAGETAEFDLSGRIASASYDQLRYTLSADGKVFARNTTPYVMNEVLLDVHPRFILGYLEVDVPLDLLQERHGDDLQLVLLAPDTAEVARQPIEGDKNNFKFDNKSPAGTYVLRIEDKNKQNISQQEFLFPGLNEWVDADKLFPKDVVLPPFEALKVNENEFSMWGRTYAYGNSLFPEQIVSLGENMFASAPELIVNGKPVALQSFEKGAVSKHRAEFTASAGNDECSVQEDGWIEYDGVSYSRFSLKAKEDLDDVKLRFTLPYDVARYLHAVVGGSWGAKITKPVKDGRIDIGIYPIVWIGKEDKGICLFTETVANWKFPKGKMVSIEKQGNVATVEFNMCSAVKHGEKFDFEFGYVASPVKPQQEHFPLNTDGDMHCAPMQRPGSSAHVGYHIIASTPYPHEIDDFFAEFPNEEESLTTKHIGEAMALIDKFDQACAVYMDSRMLTEEYPEVAAFKDEWRTLPQLTLNYKKDGKQYTIYDCCPTSGANNFYCLHLKRFIERFKPNGIYYDFGTIGICSNKLHGCDQRWPILGYREFLRRTYMLLVNTGVKEPAVILHNTDFVQLPAMTFATHLLNGEHIRQHSSTIMHNGKDIQDTYGIEMFANELSSMPFGIVNSVYQANDVLLPEFGGGKEDPELYKFRITQAFLAGVLPHNTMLSQERCHYGILEKIARTYENFGVRKAKFLGYWTKPALVEGSDNIYVSVYVNASGKSALAVISHIGKDHDYHTFDVTFDANALGFTPKNAVDTMTADDPEYEELYKIRQANNVPDNRAPLKLGDFGSKINSFSNGKLNMTLKYHTFAIVELK